MAIISSASGHSPAHRSRGRSYASRTGRMTEPVREYSHEPPLPPYLRQHGTHAASPRLPGEVPSILLPPLYSFQPLSQGSIPKSTSPYWKFPLKILLYANKRIDQLSFFCTVNQEQCYNEERAERLRIAINDGHAGKPKPRPVSGGSPDKGDYGWLKQFSLLMMKKISSTP